MYYREGFLAQVLVYSAFWLIDEYIALLVCLILGSVIGALLIFSLVVNFIEPSRVPSSFYKWMLISTVTPFLVTAVFTAIYRGNFEWLENQ